MVSDGTVCLACLIEQLVAAHGGCGASGEDDGEDGYEEVERHALDFLRDAMTGISTTDGIWAAEAALYHVREMRGV